MKVSSDRMNVAVTGMGALTMVGAATFFGALFWVGPWWFRVLLLAPFALLGLAMFIARKRPEDTWLTFFGLTLGLAAGMFVVLAMAQTYLLVGSVVGG